MKMKEMRFWNPKRPWRAQRNKATGVKHGEAGARSVSAHGIRYNGAEAVEAQADPLDPTTQYFLNRFIHDFYSRHAARSAMGLGHLARPVASTQRVPLVPFYSVQSVREW